MLIKTVLQQKGSAVSMMAADVSIADAAAVLATEHGELVVVCDDAQKVVGVVSDSDIMRRIAECDGRACSCVTSVGDVMTREVITCKPDEELRDVWKTLSDRGLRRVPVVDDNGKLSGVINLRDIFRFLSEEAQLESRELWRFLAPPAMRGEPMTEVLEILHQEHFRIAAALSGLRHLAAALNNSATDADTGLLTAILDYMEAFADTLHHPKEEAYLFEALRQRKPAEADVLDHLIDEHAIAKTMLSEVRAKLQLFHDEASSYTGLQQAVNSYVDFEQAHMRREENIFMPLAARYLKSEDWNRIHQAFMRNDDPLFGEERRTAFDELFNYIRDHLQAAPALTRAD